MVISPAGEGPAVATSVGKPLGSHLALAVLVRMKPHPETAASRRHIVKAAEAFLRARCPIRLRSGTSAA